MSIRMQLVIPGQNKRSCLVVDPSVFNFKSRLLSFANSGLLDHYAIFIPSSIYDLIQNEDVVRIINALKTWETVNLFKPRIVSWLESKEFQKISKFVYSKSQSLDLDLSNLSQEESKRFNVFLETIKIESQNYSEIMKEILKASFVRGMLILSFSTNFLIWLRDFSNLLLSFLRNERSRLHDHTLSIKRSLNQKGWKGQVFVWLLAYVDRLTIETLEYMSPKNDKLRNQVIALIKDGSRI